jgi:hypothetical protein
VKKGGVKVPAADEKRGVFATHQILRAHEALRSHHLPHKEGASGMKIM